MENHLRVECIDPISDRGCIEHVDRLVRRHLETKQVVQVGRRRRREPGHVDAEVLEPLPQPRALEPGVTSHEYASAAPRPSSFIVHRPP
jgi:hypothetical protein